MRGCSRRVRKFFSDCWVPEWKLFVTRAGRVLMQLVRPLSIIICLQATRPGDYAVGLRRVVTKISSCCLTRHNVDHRLTKNWIGSGQGWSSSKNTVLIQTWKFRFAGMVLLCVNINVCIYSPVYQSLPFYLPI